MAYRTAMGVLFLRPEEQTPHPKWNVRRDTGAIGPAVEHRKNRLS